MTAFAQIFERFWSETVPLPFRANRALKEKAKEQWNVFVAQLFEAAGQPDAVKTLACMLKIGRMLQTANVIIQDPNPDPELITSAVQQLLERLKLPIQQQEES